MAFESSYVRVCWAYFNYSVKNTCKTLWPIRANVLSFQPTRSKQEQLRLGFAGCPRAWFRLHVLLCEFWLVYRDIFVCCDWPHVRTVESRFLEPSIAQSPLLTRQTKVVSLEFVFGCNLILPRHLKLPIFWSNFRFPGRFKKSEFHCSPVFNGTQVQAQTQEPIKTLRNASTLAYVSVCIDR